MMFGGGRARGENISPGALAGSLGGRDHITQPPRSEEGVCFGDGGVDVDSVTSLGCGCGEGGGSEEGGGGGNWKDTGGGIDSCFGSGESGCCC
jgi:hypothetical protein